MKGNNTITWNNQTMQEAVQEYLDKRLVGKNPDKVTWVSAAAGSKFVIATQEVKETE